jgi:hypothetical protein
MLTFLRVKVASSSFPSTFPSSLGAKYNSLSSPSAQSLGDESAETETKA